MSSGASGSKGKRKRGRPAKGDHNVEKVTDDRATDKEGASSGAKDSDEELSDKNDDQVRPNTSGDANDGSQLDSDKFQLLLSAINSSKKSMEQQMASQLAAFKEELRSSHEETSERLAKRVRRNKPLDFRRKGNELQYKFNEGVIENYDDIEGELEKLATEKLPKGVKSQSSHLKKVNNCLITGKS